ncbi:MAG: hypothetical protein A2X86_00545 [Bdellovibrionales bacterium GWA2_49_15]|nr:MAG: hypothetical protein A2X86_00545 [Bdellovibrionales bacterium GWA2_49_15]
MRSYSKTPEEIVDKLQFIFWKTPHFLHARFNYFIFEKFFRIVLNPGKSRFNLFPNFPCSQTPSKILQKTGQKLREMFQNICEDISDMFALLYLNSLYSIYFSSH